MKRLIFRLYSTLRGRQPLRSKRMAMLAMCLSSVSQHSKSRFFLPLLASTLNGGFHLVKMVLHEHTSSCLGSQHLACVSFKMR